MEGKSTMSKASSELLPDAREASDLLDGSRPSMNYIGARSKGQSRDMVGFPKERTHVDRSSLVTSGLADRLQLG